MKAIATLLIATFAIGACTTDGRSPSGSTAQRGMTSSTFRSSTAVSATTTTSDLSTSTTTASTTSTASSEEIFCEQPVVVPDPGDLIVVLYEICDKGGGTGNRVLAGLQPVERAIAAADSPLRAAFEALLAGPVPEETAAGFGSWFSSATTDALLGASIDNRMATIDLDADVIGGLNNVSTSTGGSYFRGQLYGTVFAFDEINTVGFSLDGIASGFCALMELIPDCTPVTRDQWNEIYSHTFRG